MILVEVYRANKLVIYKSVFFKLININHSLNINIVDQTMDNSNYDDQVLMGENMPDLSKIEEAIPLIIFNEEKRCKYYYFILIS